MALQIIVLIILLLLSAFFSGVEIAFFSLSNIKVRNLVDKKVKNADLVKKLKDNPQRLLITILIGNNIVNIGAASLATVLAISLFGSKGAGIATGIITFLVLVFGEITPKALATIKNRQICLLVAKPILFLTFILYPVIMILELITKLVTRLSHAKPKPLISEEELKIMAKIGVEEKTIEKHEGEIISKVFELNDITTEDIMTPKSEMEILDSDILLCDALSRISKLPFSRIPIFAKDKDNIIGVIYVKDILKETAKCVVAPGKYDDLDLKLIDIARKTLFVPSQMLIRDLLKEFQIKHIQIALVVDETGSLLGLVTLEDILEELVGEIIDETDIEKELIKRLDKKNIIVNGMTEIEYVNHFFNTRIKGPRKEYISAYLLEKFGKIPEVGDEIEIDGIIYFISDADEKKINKIKITKK